MRSFFGIVAFDEIPELLKVRENSPCAHDNCSECNGSLKRLDGSPCIHMISCRCDKCRPYQMGGIRG